MRPRTVLIIALLVVAVFLAWWFYPSFGRQCDDVELTYESGLGTEQSWHQGDRWIINDLDGYVWSFDTPTGEYMYSTEGVSNKEAFLLFKTNVQKNEYVRNNFSGDDLDWFDCAWRKVDV